MSASFNSAKHALAFLTRHGQIDGIEIPLIYLKRGAIEPDDETISDLLDDAYDMVREAGYQVIYRRPPYEMVVDEIEAPGPIPLSAETAPMMGTMSSVVYTYPITTTFTVDTESSDWDSDGN